MMSVSINDPTGSDSRMGKHYSLQLSYNNDDADSFWSSGDRTLVAGRGIDGFPDRGFLVYSMAKRKNLSYRNPDVWKKAKLEGNDQMGIQEELILPILLATEMFLIVKIFLSF